MINTELAEIKTDLVRDQEKTSMRLETKTSNNEMEEVRAVNTRRRKNTVEITTVPGSLEKRIGRVLNTKPAPPWG
jgi:3-dehydroquinate dehydratase